MSRKKIKKIIEIVLLIMLTLILSFISFNINVSAKEDINKDVKITIHTEEVIGDKTKVVEKVEKVEKTKTIYDLYTQDEIDILCNIVQAEVGDYSEVCKINVANVIINRTNSTEFPDTIEDVVYQKGQFQSVTNNRINEVTVTKDTIKAVEKIFEEKDSTKGSLYFMNKNGSTQKNINWFNNNLTYIMTDESGHSFYK